MSPRKYSAAALLLIATCTIATALAPRFSGTATAAVLAWPVDLTYELTQRQGDTVFTSTHRFVGTGWNDWRDEVLELERTGPLTDETTVPAGPGSSTTYTPDGTLTTVHWLAFTEQPAEIPFTNTEQLEPGAAWAPGRLFASTPTQLDLRAVESNTDDPVLDALSEEASSRLLIDVDQMSTSRRMQPTNCPAGSGCQGTAEEFLSVYVEQSAIPLSVQLLENGGLVEELRVLKVDSTQ